MPFPLFFYIFGSNMMNNPGSRRQKHTSFVVANEIQARKTEKIKNVRDETREHHLFHMEPSTGECMIEHHPLAPSNLGSGSLLTEKVTIPKPAYFEVVAPTCSSPQA